MNKDVSSYLSVLNPEQMEAVCHTGSPLLILAGAGSGKTRVITTKIAWLIAEQGVSPDSILAVTFTNKAAREMKERAQQLDIRAKRAVIRTFHSFGAWLLRRYAEWAGLSPHFTIYDDEDSTSLLMKIQPKFNKQEAQIYIRKISHAKDLCLTPDNPLLARIDPDPEFAKIYSLYQQRLQETGNTDFGDLIMLPVLLLHNHSAMRAALHQQFKVILVDEYQDTNSAQFQLLQALSGQDTYVCVVGDDDQSIYRFRGAEIQNILTFENHFSNTKIIRLVQNYRSYAPILRVADSIVSHNEDRLGKTLTAARGEGNSLPQLFYLPNQDAESELCIQLIRRSLKNGSCYADWAILYRTNAQSLNFETAFLHEKIPYQVVGALKFYDREEIKDTIALLSLIANGRDEVAFRRMINKPTRGIGEVTQNKLINYARTKLFPSNQELYPEGKNNDLFSIILQELPHIALSKKIAAAVQQFLIAIESLKNTLMQQSHETHSSINSLLQVSEQNMKTVLDTERLTQPAGEGLAVFVQTVIVKTGLETFYKSQDEVKGTQKIANLQELINAASFYPCSVEGLAAFLEHIELDRSLAGQAESTNAVQLITMHNTKGLEYKHVIITGLENGIFPRNDASSKDLEEERRLMYVACTRAQDSLYMTSCAARRMYYGKLSFMQPSMFLMEIDSELVNITGKYCDGFGYIPHDESAQWKCGQKVYHNEYGYGQVSKAWMQGRELIIIVQFENGRQAKFFPAYQKHILFRVDNC